MLERSFWNSDNELTPTADALGELIPHSGEVENKKQNKALEKFRKAQNCYYDLYNNGLYNRAGEFRHVFGIASSKYKMYRGDFTETLYEAVEPEMEKIVLAAAKEQGIEVVRLTENDYKELDLKRLNERYEMLTKRKEIVLKQQATEMEKLKAKHEADLKRLDELTAEAKAQLGK